MTSPETGMYIYTEDSGERQPIPDSVMTIIDSHIELLQEPDVGILAEQLLDFARANPQLDPTLITKTMGIAGIAHLDQLRIFTGQKYILHPLRVAFLSINLAQAMDVAVTNELIVGALLHDTIEDTPTSKTRILRRRKPLFTEKSLRNKFLAGFDEQVAREIAADSEALNHNTVKRHGTVNSEKYVHKITKNADESVMLRRRIIKAADRIDNLLDPLVLPDGFESRSDNLSVKFRRSRISYIDRTKDPKHLMRRLLPAGSFLDLTVQTAGELSRQTLRHTDFNPSQWKKTMPITIYRR